MPDLHIVLEMHATSADNLTSVASGWHDAPLSPLGERQARELGERRPGDRPGGRLLS